MMLKSDLCNYKDAYILVKGIVTVVWKVTNKPAMSAVKKDKEKYLKLYSSITVLYLPTA